VAYDIWVNTGEEGPVYVETISTPFLASSVGDNDGGCGGGSQSDAGVRIVAHDNAGNTVSVDVFYGVSEVRWNNTGLYGNPHPGWTYTGSWATSTGC
jgi:hypothetical protein